MPIAMGDAMHLVSRGTLLQGILSACMPAVGALHLGRGGDGAWPVNWLHAGLSRLRPAGTCAPLVCHFQFLEGAGPARGNMQDESANIVYS